VSCEGSMIKDACGCRSMVSSAALLPNGERSCAPVRIYGEQRYVLGYVPTGGLHEIKPGDRVTIETGLRTAEGIVGGSDCCGPAVEEKSGSRRTRCWEQAGFFFSVPRPR